MIDKLLNWEFRNKSLARLGRNIEGINKEFLFLDLSLTNGHSFTGVNMHRARGLQRRIELLTKKAEKIEISGRDQQSRFDNLALKEFMNSLFVQKEFIQFFFTWRYNKNWGVRSFLNYAFFPQEDFEEKDEKNGALAYLEEIARNTTYSRQTQRENMMHDIIIHGVSLNPSELEEKMCEQLPFLRKVLADYNSEMGFETREQIEKQTEIARLKDLEKTRERIKRFFGTYKGVVNEAMIADIERGMTSLKSKISEPDEKLKQFMYEIILSDDECYGSWTPSTRTMEVTPWSFYFYKDKKDSSKIKFYSGDLLRVIGHENYHRLQSIFSKSMPVGLRGTNDEYNITASTITEGTPTYLEENFLNWLEENRRKYDLSQRDINIAKLFRHEWSVNKITRLLHSIYHREETPLEKNEDRQAHLRLARLCRVPVLADDDYLYNESFPEIYYSAFYFFGEKYVNQTMQKLEKIEKERLGSLRKARRFLRTNEPLVIQGLLTGNWGWSTHGDFFLKHYWPKARKYCN